MGAEQDNLILQAGIAAGEGGDHVPRRPLLCYLAKAEFAGDILDEAAAVPSWLQPELGQLGGDIGGGNQLIASAATPSLKSVAGEESEFPPDVAGKRTVIFALLAREDERETESDN